MDQPNILLIHWHDVGQHVSPYGHPDVPSPALESLAADGVTFDRAFCTAPLCSPARGSLFTGRYPHSNGLMGLAHLGWRYNSNERTLPMYLKDAGYHTTLVGVQHEDQDSTTLGFDDVLTLGGPQQFAQPVSELASIHLRAEATSSQPFFMSVGFFEPHRPFPESLYPPVDPDSVEVPPFLPDTPDTREDLAAFYGSIAVADRATGVVLDALETAGLSDDTWVIFTADHGMAFPRAKSTLFDPGLEVPLIMRLPRSWDPPAEDYPGMVSHVDIVPTVLDQLGLEVPTHVQGHSFSPWLRGEDHTVRSAVFGEKNWHDPDHYDPVRCVRTDRYKYIESYEPRPALWLSQDLEDSPTRRGMGNQHLEPRAPIELYDLQDDPWEQKNLADDGAYADVCAGLTQQLARWRTETQDPLLVGPLEGPVEQGRRHGAPPELPRDTTT